jgi:nucleotide-binding universal stress UspA family protein
LFLHGWETIMSFATGLKTIVVATDLNARSEAALSYARKIAEAYGSRIMLAYTLDPLEYAPVEAIPGRVRSDMPEQARAELNKMADELVRQGIHSHSEIRQGSIVQMLVDVARQHQAGLIVVGTEGRDGAGPVLVGALAEELARLAPCPVLAVAADWNAGQFRPTPGGPVLLAVEKNEATQTAAAVARSLAETFKRPLLVVHAQTPVEPSKTPVSAETKWDELGIAPGELPQLQYIAKEGNPVEAVSFAVSQYHPSILVLGVKRTSETAGAHGTAFSLLATSRVPVLCVPPETASAA